MIDRRAAVRVFHDNDYWQVENLVREFMNNDPYSPPIIVRQMQDLFGPFFLVAQDTNSPDILGYVMGGIEFSNKSIGWVLEIYVKEDARNHGIGYELLRAVINTLKQSGVSEIRLTVDPQNISAINIYKKCGFLEVDCLNEHYRKEKKVFLMKTQVS